MFMLEEGRVCVVGGGGWWVVRKSGVVEGL
jgi:hypothetical protein